MNFNSNLEADPGSTKGAMEMENINTDAIGMDLNATSNGVGVHLPIRRYAIFSDIIRGHYAIVVRGDDIARAPKWGGFVSWLGGVKPSEVRTVRKNSFPTKFQQVQQQQSQQQLLGNAIAL